MSSHELSPHCQKRNKARSDQIPPCVWYGKLATPQWQIARTERWNGRRFVSFCAEIRLAKFASSRSESHDAWSWMFIDDAKCFMGQAWKGPGGMRFMLNAGCSADLWNARGQTSKMGHFSFSTSLSLTCVMRWALLHPQFLYATRSSMCELKVDTDIILFACLHAYAHLMTTSDTASRGSFASKLVRPLPEQRLRTSAAIRGSISHAMTRLQPQFSGQFGTGLQPIWSTHKQWVELSHKARLNI